MAVMLIFALGIYASLQSTFRVIYQSRIRIIETAVLNEQIELIHNIGYTDIGIVEGSPAGVLERTVTTTKSGFEFEITRTIRAIDDPFDGVIGGTPNDTAPVDYKFVQIDILCSNCGQDNHLSATTYVPPRYLEGDPTNGALFIEVFDAQGTPVVGADVHIVSTSTDPVVNFSDTTDNQGLLRILDLDAAIQRYHILVTKDGYTSDYTMSSTLSNPNPTKFPASVAASDVTEISFSIDEISRFNISSLDEQCTPVPDVRGVFSGTKLIGTEPTVLRNVLSFNTGAAATQSLVPVEWDTYTLDISSHNIVGTIPETPLTLLPSNTQPVSLIVAPSTANSLWVIVRDNDSKQPLANAAVSITRLGIVQSAFTGVGTIRQTTWDQGPGQEYYVDDARFFASTNTDPYTLPGDITLSQTLGTYAPSGVLESSIIDTSQSSTLVNIIWEPLIQPASTSVYFQIATANSTSTSTTWDYLGPDGTSTTFYTVSSTSVSPVHADNRFVRYKLYLKTQDETVTPLLSDVAITYTTSCTPPGQTYFGSLSAAEYTLDVSKSGYQSQSIPVTPDGNTPIIVDLTAE